MERKLKDSGIPWIGQIPEHWKSVRFKSKFATRKGLSITKADLTESGIPVINYGQIHSKHNNGTTVTADIIKYVPQTYLQSDSNALVDKGDFIFADTSEDIAGCGNCAYIDCDSEIFGGYHTIIASGGGNNKYFSYLFLTDAWRSQIRCNVTGIKVFSISQSILANTRLIAPPVAEQDAIAAYLDKKCGEIDELIEVEQQMISDLESYRQSVITEAVTHGLNSNTLLYYSGNEWIGEVPEHWRLIPVQHFFEFRNGYTPSKANSSFWTNGFIPWFRMEDIRNSGRFLKESLQYITPEAMNNGGTFEAGSFILAICTASIGEHALLIADSLANQQFTNLKIRKSLSAKVDTKYIFYYMFILGRFCKDTAIVTTFPYADMTRVKNFLVTMPPLNEQQEIANYLDRICAEIDELIKVKQEKIETLKQYRQSLIFEAVTGKTSITSNV